MAAWLSRWSEVGRNSVFDGIHYRLLQYYINIVITRCYDIFHARFKPCAVGNAYTIIVHNTNIIFTDAEILFVKY
jgi:hypothetical protein